MPQKNKIRKSRMTPEYGDKFFMVETLLFIIFMVVCTGAILFVLYRLVIRLSQSVAVSMPT